MRPGIKTSEFWLTSAAMVIGCLLESGSLGEGPVAVAAGAALQVLSLLGYQRSRAVVKASRPG